MEKVGNIIKSTSIVLFIINCIAFLSVGIALGVEYPIYLLFFPGGIIASFVLFILMYGFGQLVDNVNVLRERVENKDIKENIEKGDNTVSKIESKNYDNTISKIESKNDEDLSNLTPEEINNIGKKYFNSRFPDYNKAVKYFVKAAPEYDNAKYNLALCFLNGYGVTKNKDFAIKLLDELAENGHEKAKELLEKIDK